MIKRTLRFTPTAPASIKSSAENDSIPWLIPVNRLFEFEGQRKGQSFPGLKGADDDLFVDGNAGVEKAAVRPSGNAV